jgi:DNA-binding PadR family transcriptional regulator
VPRRADDPKWDDPGLLVMGSLAEGAKHGYAILQDVEQTTGRRMGPGTLYGALARLEERGLIESSEGSDPRRRPYRLTPRGTAVLSEQLESMRRFATMGRRRLGRAGLSVGWA